MRPVKLPDVIAKATSTYHTVEQCILLFEVVSMILAQFIRIEIFTNFCYWKNLTQLLKKMPNQTNSYYLC